MRKRRSLFVVIMCIALLFSTAAVYGADLDQKIEEEAVDRTVTSGTVGFARYSALCGKVTITGSSSGVDMDYVKATITLERQYSDGWRTYHTAYDVFGDAEMGAISYSGRIDVTVSGTYRIKVVFEDKKGSVTSTLSPVYSKAASL